MDAVTYPNEQVAEYIDKHFVPIQINVKDDPGAFERFHASWTPTIMMKDDRGREYRRTEGYLEPSELIAELALGRVRAAMGHHDFQHAATLAEEALSLTGEDPNRRPEALYWLGVCEYKRDHDAAGLLKQWNTLLTESPDSIWAHKASFIK